MSWRGKGSRQSRGYGAAWDKARKLAMHRDNHLCQPCKRQGKTTPARECDHVIPKAKGGDDRQSNLQAICRACHREKTLAEAAEAKGSAYVPRPTIGLDGWPEE